MVIRIIGVPSAWGTSGPGARATPRRLRDAGLVEWLTDAGLEVEDGGDLHIARQGDDFPGAEQVARVAEMADQVRRATLEALGEGSLPLLIGGECSLSIGVIAALAAYAGAPTVAWFDAHGDLNTPDTSTSGLVTGMPLAAALGSGHLTLTAIGEDAPRPTATFLVGARDLDPGERDHVEQLDVQVLDPITARADGPEEVAMRILGVPEIAVIPPEARAQFLAAEPGAAVALESPSPPVYLHFDVDALDPEFAPGVYFDVPGGFDPAEIATLAGYLCVSGRVGALAIASANLDNDVGDCTVESIRDVIVSVADAFGFA